MFQSSFELTGYITSSVESGLDTSIIMFQSSFELTGYITEEDDEEDDNVFSFKALSSLRVI